MPDRGIRQRANTAPMPRSTSRAVATGYRLMRSSQTLDGGRSYGSGARCSRPSGVKGDHLALTRNGTRQLCLVRGSSAWMAAVGRLVGAVVSMLRSCRKRQQLSQMGKAHESCLRTARLQLQGSTLLGSGIGRYAQVGDVVLELRRVPGATDGTGGVPDPGFQGIRFIIVFGAVACFLLRSCHWPISAIPCSSGTGTAGHAYAPRPRPIPTMF